MDLNNGVELLEQSTYFLDSVLQRTDQISQTKVDEEIVESILSLSIKRCVCFLYPGIPRDSSSNINAYDKETLDNLSSAFSDVLSARQQCLARVAVSPTTMVPGYDPEGPSPSEEDNNVVVELISLDKRHSKECYVLDVVDPLTQSTQLGIDLYIQALDLVRDRME